MIFISYEAGSKAYRAYNPTTSRVHATRDIVFDDVAQWDWDKDAGKRGASSCNDIFTVEYPVEDQEPPKPDGTIEVRNDGVLGPEMMSPPSAHSSGGAVNIQDHGRQVEFATPPSVQSDQLDADHDDAPLRF